MTSTTIWKRSMKMTIWIDTAGRPSNSAKALSENKGFKRNMTYKFIKPGDLVVNWGSSKMKPLPEYQVLNMPAAVAAAANKLIAFGEMSTKDVNTVEWTANREIAQKWSTDGHTVVVRNKLTGHSGDGIIIIEKGQEVPQAPLYSKYVFKTKEYRVHVANGQVIDTQQKIRDPEKTPSTWKVRSHENGFIYARNNVEANSSRDALAVAAVVALSLDCGAVDIIEDKHGVFYVLEINTAPGLEGQTLTNYTEAFQAWAK